MIINIKGDWIFTPGQALNLLLFSSRQKKRSNGSENLRFVRSFPRFVVPWIISIVYVSWSFPGLLEGFNNP
jgi:hypothetical protein